MNRWSVYEYMKFRYMQTGLVPSLGGVIDRFRHLPLEELCEGIKEFYLIAPKLKKAYDREQQEKLGA